ncbi:YciI family protein [Pseudarthrobacter sp. alpha12b]
MEFVVLYRLREGTERVRLLEVYPRHKAYYEAFRAAGGGLIALGPFQTPDPGGSSMGIFSSREDAERFIAQDPFVTEGLADPRILEWNAVRFE